jgi:hypothetical protein
MTTNQEPSTFKRIPLFLVLFLVPLLLASPGRAASPEEYVAVPGLMDLRTTFSDGSHSPEDLVALARLRGFRVLFFNDHHRIKLSYGVPPFRSLFKYSKEYPSIMTHSPQAYLDEISRLSRMFPDIILVPGSIISPFYYWSGSWINGDLTVHGYDRKILAFNLTSSEDYEKVPEVESGFSLKHTGKRLPGLLLFIIPWAVGLLLAVKWKGKPRLTGLLILILASLAILDYNSFKGSAFTPYKGDQGISPFQETLNYIHGRGGFAFWNYPEQRSGVRKHGPVNVSTLPYPEVILESRNYTGFSAIYGDHITATDPGKHWDQVLREYCEGKREKPVWGISTADFHEDGRLGLKLGAFPTTFLVKEFSKAGVFDAIRKGRMYCSRGDGRSWPQLDYFSVVAPNGDHARMGETLTTDGFPLIRFGVSFRGDEKVAMTIHVIRGGSLLRSVSGETPLEFELLDEGAPMGRMTHYRLVDSRKHLTSNPIFVKRQN